jgi:hypothetical protein
MTDSRISEKYVDGRFYRAVSDDFNKIVRITSKVFYVLTGSNEGANDFIKQSKMCNEVVKDDLLNNNKIIINWFNNNLKKMDYAYSFKVLIGGINVNGELLYYILKSKYKSIEEIKLVNLNETKFYISNGIANNMILELYKNCDRTIDSVLDIQRKVNDFVADNDIFVNKNTKYFVVNR